MKAPFTYVLMALGLAVACQAGDFVNLDFDSPDLSRAQTDIWTGIVKVPPEAAVRGWSMQWDWTGTPLALAEMVGIQHGDAPFGLMSDPPYPSASYSVFVEDYWGYPYNSSLRPVFHLFQVGLVPQGASYLLYSIDNPHILSLDGSMRVYINGADQHVSGVADRVDVSRFAGQEVKLEFVFGSGPEYYYALDIYGFVPEPSTWVLLGVGGLVLWFVRRRQ